MKLKKFSVIAVLDNGMTTLAAAAIGVGTLLTVHLVDSLLGLPGAVYLAAVIVAGLCCLVVVASMLISAGASHVRDRIYAEHAKPLETAATDLRFAADWASRRSADMREEDRQRLAQAASAVTNESIRLNRASFRLW